MARARNIKPGLFKNEDLAECSIWTRFIFPGLWMLADREGRLEDRPKRIKGELLAFDNIEVEPLLEELARFGFIQRYEVAGRRFIQIMTFTEHQAPHSTEKDSVLPGIDGFVTVNERSRNGGITGNFKRIPYGTPVDNVNPPLEPVKPQNHNALIPDSLIPDSIKSTPNPADAGPSARPKKNAIALQTFLNECRDQGERPLRDYRPLWTYTNAAGLPEDYVALAWAEFCRRFLPGGAQEAKRQKDWRATFRKYVENNYFKLWAIDRNNQYFLTTQGKQADKFQEAKVQA